MTTIGKWYFHDLAIELDGTLPSAASLSAVTPTVGASGDSANRMMDANIGKSEVSVTTNTSASTSSQTMWHRRFLSWPLAAQTLGSGTWTMQCAAAESNANMNFSVEFRVFTYRPSTGAHQTILTLSSASAEPGTSPTNVSTTGTGTGVTVIVGDILVCEIWSTFTQSKSSVFTGTFAYDGTTEGLTVSNAAFSTPPAAVQLAPPTFQGQENSLRGDPDAIQNISWATVTRGAFY